jgi:hypothetical protein
MHRRHIIVDNMVYIGKESNELEATVILGLNEGSYVEYKKARATDQLPKD